MHCGACIPKQTSPWSPIARLYGPNRKVSNILNMLPQARHDMLVFADSDVSVAPDYLGKVIGELEKPGVGLSSRAFIAANPNRVSGRVFRRKPPITSFFPAW